MTDTYDHRKGELETYFDRTASDTWKALTSDAPVSKVRQTVRAGRDAMRETLLSWLPEDMTGLRLLDAGCGTGALSIEAAERGAQVVGIDIAGSLIEIAKARTPEHLTERIAFMTGDMLSPDLGRFDHVGAMDSLIHYAPADVVRTVAILGERTRGTMAFTYAPRTPALTVMHTVGKLFPRGDRSPRIVPVSRDDLMERLARDPLLDDWREVRTERIKSGFYQSCAQEMVRR